MDTHLYYLKCVTIDTRGQMCVYLEHKLLSKPTRIMYVVDELESKRQVVD